jgi:hypothetical protein
LHCKQRDTYCIGYLALHNVDCDLDNLTIGQAQPRIQGEANREAKCLTNSQLSTNKR